MTKKGAIVAAAVAGLFVSAPMVVHAGGKGKVKCTGVNECKGKGGCKSATNECKGHNECKGKGISMMSAKACAKKGGTVAEDAAAPAKAN